MSTRAVVLIGLVMAFGCEEADSAYVATLVPRDSARVAVLDARNPERTRGSAYRIERTIGGQDDNETGAFSYVTGLAVLTDAYIVADKDLGLRLYGVGGDYTRTLGGPGSGPGEFKLLSWLGTLAGDSIVAFAVGLGRGSVFDKRGNLARIVSMAAPGLVFDVTKTGRFVAVTMATAEGEQAQGHKVWGVASVVVSDPSGVFQDSIATFRPFLCMKVVNGICVPRGTSPGARAYRDFVMAFDAARSDVIVWNLQGVVVSTIHLKNA